MASAATGGGGEVPDGPRRRSSVARPLGLTDRRGRLDGSLVEPEARRAAWARLARVRETTWLVAVVDLERGTC